MFRLVFIPLILLAASKRPASWQPAASVQAPGGTVSTAPAQSLPDPSESSAASPSTPPAEQLLQELQARRPIHDVIPPVSAARQQHPEPALYPEGWIVVDRIGWLRQEEDGWLIEFDAEAPPIHKQKRTETLDGDPPMRLLPSANLEMMVHSARGSSSPVRFLMTAEMTVFEDENYLLVRHVRRATPDPASLRSAPDGHRLQNETTSPANPGAPNREQKRIGVPDDLPVSDVLERMKQQRPQNPVLSVPLRDAPTSATDLQPPSRPRMLKPEGSSVVRRAGRVVQDGRWWVFVFEADHPDHPEPPMRLLPCRATETMVHAARAGSAGLVFVVSGDVTLFENHNYLLPRLALRRLDDGNLRR